MVGGLPIPSEGEKLFGISELGRRIADLSEPGFMGLVGLIG